MTLRRKYNRMVRRSPFLTVNLGHILIISTWVAAALVTYGTMSQQMVNFNDRISKLELLCSKYVSIETDIGWIKDEISKRKKK